MTYRNDPAASASSADPENPNSHRSPSPHKGYTDQRSGGPQPKPNFAALSGTGREQFLNFTLPPYRGAEPCAAHASRHFLSIKARHTTCFVKHLAGFF